MMSYRSFFLRFGPALTNSSIFPHLRFSSSSPLQIIPMASSAVAFVDDDDFEEYNPHPYLGGYDMALTYGQPLPPSSATCYPILTPSSTSPSRSPPSPLTPPPAATTASPPPFHTGSPENYHPEPFPSPDLFRIWPYFSWEERQAHGDVDASADWNGWRRALDYLFGHAQGYGERRIGLDSYGIPVYANRKLGIAESVIVEAEPAPVQRLEYCDSRHSWPTSYSGTEDREAYESPIISYNKHYVETLNVEIDPNEYVSYHKLNYHEAYEDQMHHNLEFNESDYVTSFFGSPGIAYSKHRCEQPLHVQIEPTETAWSQKSSYSQVYQESIFPAFDWGSSHYGEQGAQSNFFGSSGFSHERFSQDGPDFVELEPFKPAWSRNLSCYDVYEEESQKKNWHCSPIGEQGGMTTISNAYNYFVQNEQYEQDQCVQLEPYKSSWSRHPSYYEDYNEQASQVYEYAKFSFTQYWLDHSNFITNLLQL